MTILRRGMKRETGVGMAATWPRLLLLTLTSGCQNSSPVHIGSDYAAVGGPGLTDVSIFVLYLPDIHRKCTKKIKKDRRNIGPNCICFLTMLLLLSKCCRADDCWLPLYSWDEVQSLAARWTELSLQDVCGHDDEGELHMAVEDSWLRRKTSTICLSEERSSSLSLDLILIIIIFSYHPCLGARRLEKFREETAIPEVTLNFKPNFKFSLLSFFFGGDPIPIGMCANKAWSISSACKTFRAQQPLWAEI